MKLLKSFKWVCSLIGACLFSTLSISWGREEPVNYWAIEDAEAREQLPEYKVIPAATLDELTPSKRLPFREDYRDWPRSHGDAYSSRYSALTEINRSNVRNLEVAWIYRSGDTPGNIQCNPIVVDGVMYAFTSGNHVVAVDAANGKELWQYTLPFGGTAPPSIYQADGKQFVVVAATGGGKLRLPPGDAYVAFSLP